MAIELRQQLKLTQQLVMTPQLQQAIKLLQLSRLELMDMITQEMEINPALEEIQDFVNPEDNEHGQAEQEIVSDEASVEKEVTIEEKLSDNIDWSNYIDEYNTPGKAGMESEDRDSPRFEAFIAQKQSLSDHLLWQLMMLSPSEEEKKIGSLIIGNLNKNGYLDVPLEDLAIAADSTVEEVDDALFLLQTFDPIGVCASNLAECLLIQAKYYRCDTPMVTDIISNHLSNLENKNYKAICRALKTDLDEILAAVNIIKGLDPRPGLRFSDEDPQYINPDIYVHKYEDDFVIALNDDGMPRLCVNSFYQNVANNNGELSDQAKDYMHEKVRSAVWLIKSIQQRQKTIYRVMESILKYQRDFFDKGIEHLKPMVLRDVALDIDMHESTISRVTTNKYAYTPQGIFELKYFFNTSINSVRGQALSSTSVQQRIKQLVDSEDNKNPYSDKEISDILKESDINIARRTVAKYREMMGILSSGKRRQL
ncbi:MAG: RNA polymerase factor sigma-54 [Desulfobacterales bacterium]|nr:RNA polymerase factor sigma-54 [Desulfobacterales bacterium]